MAKLPRRFKQSGVARCQDDGAPRTVFVHPSRQMGAIHVTAQTNVTEDEVNPGTRRLKNIDSLHGSGSAVHLEPAILQVFANHELGQRIVFDNEDRRRASPSSPKSDLLPGGLFVLSARLGTFATNQLGHQGSGFGFLTELFGN